MKKTTDILKEIKEEFIERFANHPDSSEHHAKLLNDRWDADDIWFFIESKLKQAVEAERERINKRLGEMAIRDEDNIKNKEQDKPSIIEVEGNYRKLHKTDLHPGLFYDCDKCQKWMVWRLSDYYSIKELEKLGLIDK